MGQWLMGLGDRAKMPAKGKLLRTRRLRTGVAACYRRLKQRERQRNRRLFANNFLRQGRGGARMVF